MRGGRGEEGGVGGREEGRRRRTGGTSVWIRVSSGGNGGERGREGGRGGREEGGGGGKKVGYKNMAITFYFF